MMPPPVFTPQELAALQNTGFFLLKQSATNKILQLFGILSDNMKQLPQHLSFRFPDGCDVLSGKISKGENYRNLPYMVLDFPRLFKPDDIFACRTLFWWGHGFSFTLLLQGSSLHRYWPAISSNYHLLSGQNYYLSVAQTPWRHEFTPNSYQPCSRFGKAELEQQVFENGFFKIALPLPLEQWSNVPEVGLQCYRQYLQLLTV